MSATTTSNVRLNALKNAKPDTWIAFSDDESQVVATGATYCDVATQSEKAGVNDPVIVKVPSQWAPISV